MRISEEAKRAQIRKDLDELEKTKDFKFFQCVSKITITKDTDSKILKLLEEYDIHAETIWKK